MYRGIRRALPLLLCFAAIIDSGSASERKGPAVDQPAPDFRLTTFDGHKLSLADFKGQVVVLNFWATWCGPCKRELPLLESFYRKQQSSGLVILAVATEDSLTPYQLRPLAKVLTLPMVKRFKGDYGDIKELPTNFVIDRKGVLRYAEAGAFTEDSIVEVLAPLLAEAPPQASGSL